MASSYRLFKKISTDAPAGRAYRPVIVTQTSAKHGGNLLKTHREVKSERALTAQAESAGQA